jgi:hypothetical protein
MMVVLWWIGWLPVAWCRQERDHGGDCFGGNGDGNDELNWARRHNGWIQASCRWWWFWIEHDLYQTEPKSYKSHTTRVQNAYKSKLLVICLLSFYYIWSEIDNNTVCGLDESINKSLDWIPWIGMQLDTRDDTFKLWSDYGGRINFLVRRSYRNVRTRLSSPRYILDTFQRH